MMIQQQQQQGASCPHAHPSLPPSPLSFSCWFGGSETTVVDTQKVRVWRRRRRGGTSMVGREGEREGECSLLLVQWWRDDSR